MLNRSFTLCCLVLALPWALTNCSRAEPIRAEFALGTVCSITLFDQARSEIYRDIFSRLREIEDLMSVNIKGSDIDRINAAAGLEPIQVQDDVFELIEKALYFTQLSEGAFNLAVGPLVSLWGISGDNPRLPSPEEIEAVLPLIKWQDIELDRERQSVFLKQPGMALDLGGIAKGYAADEAASIIRKARVKRAIIDLGGNIFLCGEKKDKSPWKVGIQNPLEDRGAYMGIVQGPEQTVVTSGVYERYFEMDGTRYHHIFSPFDGYPVHNGLLSATIIADNSADADALSTAVFVLGYEKGRALIESLQGIEAVFIFDDMSVRKTKGADFILSDNSYRLLPDWGNL